ncbi:MAG: hypothetical protein J0L81_00035 [Caulobacterales bacterium]|jgi:hypothetical protein|nr:hypothetical protein [Caulobacterales bacterium]
MTQTRSVDVAARGYIRHRFVRALNASFVVLMVFGLVGLVVGAMMHAIGTGEWAQIVGLPLGAALAFLLFLAPMAIVIGATTAIIDGLHRRVVGFALLLAALFLFAFFGLAFIAFVSSFFGLEITDDPEINPAAMAAFGLFGALISYQLLRHAWWQTTSPALDYKAARGWRPPPWRFLTAFRRHLGLPGFIAYVGNKRLVASLLYFFVAVLNVGIALLLLLPLFLSSPTERTENFDPANVIIGSAILLLLNVVGAGSLLSRLADDRATKLYQNVREWDARAPIVFLRAFNQDDARLKARGGDAFARWPAGVGRPRTLDEILLEHASPYGPVIAIGDPRDPTPPLGAARVFVEGEGEEWQGVVRGLAGASKAVVMCPNHGEGVKWELDLISQAGGRLQVIFLASPELDRETTHALFQRLVPNMPEIEAKQTIIAAYELGGEWRVLTAAERSVDSYTGALNTALQALFGMKGEPAKRKKLA